MVYGTGFAKLLIAILQCDASQTHAVCLENGSETCSKILPEQYTLSSVRQVKTSSALFATPIWEFWSERLRGWVYRQCRGSHGNCLLVSGRGCSDFGGAWVTLLRVIIDAY